MTAADYPACGDQMADDLTRVLGPDVITAAQCIEADDILRTACREAVAALKLGRRIDRTVPASTIAKYLRLAAQDAAEVLPDEPLHLGSTVVWPRGAAA